MKGGGTKCRRLWDLIEETGFFVMTLEEEGFSLSLNSKEEDVLNSMEEDVLNLMEEDADSFKQMI
jgi:hypothetical protein